MILHTVVFMVSKYLHYHNCMWSRIYYISCINIGDGVWVKIEYLQDTMKPLTSYLELPVTILVILYKSLCIEAMRYIVS